LLAPSCPVVVGIGAGSGLARIFSSAVPKSANGGGRSRTRARRIGIDAAMMVIALSAMPHDTRATVSTVAASQ